MPLGDRLPRYCIADLVIDVGRRSVRRGAVDIHLSKLSFDLLRVLIEAAPNVVSNDELTRTVWKGLVVGPESVTQRVKLLRDALGDDAEAPRYIVGLRGQGYRVLPPVTLEPETSDAGRPEAKSSVNRRTRPRMVGIVLGATVFAVTLTYFVVDQFLIAKHGQASQPVTAASQTTSHASAGSGAVAVPEMGPFAPPPHSIAVLPFVNISGDRDQEYFADGMTEELLNSLSRINELQVAGRTSSFYFKGKDVDLGTVARRLNVAAILEGSVRRSGHTVRVTAQLISATSGFHLWSQAYDRDLGDVLAMQTEIANSVASALKVTLLGDVTAMIDVGGTRNPRAHDAYLRAASAFWHVSTASDEASVIAGYKEAVRLDPSFARAYAGWSIALHVYAQNFAHGSAVHDWIRRQRDPALKAVALAPELTEGHVALALFLLHSLDFPGAEKEFERAVALEPGNPRILKLYGQFEVIMGHTDAGLAAARRAVALDPLNANNPGFLSENLRFARLYNESIAAYKDAVLLDPDDADLRLFGALTYYALGDFEKLPALCQDLNKSEAKSDESCLALAFHKLGQHAHAETELARLKNSEGDYGAYQYAGIYAQWGNSAKALEWLETAFRLHDPGLYYLKVEPLLDPLRKEPRFQAIERTLKFPK